MEQSEQNTAAAGTMPAEIAAGIVKVMAGVKRIAKDSENKFQKYPYASIDAFLEAVGPLEAEAGICILPEELSEEVVELAKADRESGLSHWLKIRWAFTLAHASGVTFGPMHRTVWVPAAGAQAYGSAQSYSLKQFMRGLYQIPTGDADDPDAQQAEPLPQQQRRQPPSKANGNHPPADSPLADKVNPKKASEIMDAQPARLLELTAGVFGAAMIAAVRVSYIRLLAAAPCANREVLIDLGKRLPAAIIPEEDKEQLAVLINGKLEALPAQQPAETPA